jgi:hypothetical protein
MSDSNKLHTAVKKLSEVIDDLTSLDVQTFTGNLDIKISQAAKNATDAETTKSELMDMTIDNLPKEGNFKLVARSLYKFDGDSYNFITNESGVPQTALELHKSAVESGIKTRQGLVEMAKSFVGL